MPPPLTAGRLVIKFAVGVTLFALLLLVPAGTWRWPAAWVFLGLYFAFAIPVGVWLLAVGIVVRTVLEDRTLHAELPGYPDYAAKVRWRLLPHVF